jgi:hypothetical protein
MSEQQSQSDRTATMTETQQEGPDVREPTPERQAELLAAYEANVAAGKAPYAGVPIRTRSEVSWVMRERHWWGGPDPLPEGYGRADLRGANCFEANLRGVLLAFANLRGTVLDSADLRGADLRATRLDEATELYHVVLDAQTRLADIIWNGAPLTRVDWAQVPMLGDEQVARTARDLACNHKDNATRLDEYTDAVTANRQLATVLRSQGLNEHADRFAYRAQHCQREVLRRQGIKKRPAYLGSILLWALSGYGYRLWRILAAYGLVLVAFTLTYCALGVHSHSGEPGIQALWDSFLVSLSAIHGRTTFEQLGAWTPTAWVAAVESVVGIVIEGVFVAMLIQRFFAR